MMQIPSESTAMPADDAPVAGAEPASGAGPRVQVGRRAVLRGGVLVPVSGMALASCGQDEEPGSGDTSAQDEAEGDSGSTDSAEGFPSSEVPVGGASYDEESNTVFSQPSDGQFKAFDATCPHEGCSVSNFAEGRLVCPCHNSQFDPATGEVLGGPATTGLTPKEVTVSGDDLLVT